LTLLKFVAEMSLIPPQGVNFIKVLHTAFALVDPESVKKIAKLTVFFTLLGSAGVKGVHRALMKSSQGITHSETCGQ